jgi:hypothetical protein
MATALAGRGIDPGPRETLLETEKRAPIFQPARRADWKPHRRNWRYRVNSVDPRTGGRKAAVECAGAGSKRRPLRLQERSGYPDLLFERSITLPRGTLSARPCACFQRKVGKQRTCCKHQRVSAPPQVVTSPSSAKAATLLVPPLPAPSSSPSPARRPRPESWGH